MQPYKWTSTHRPSPRRRSSTPRSKPRSTIVSSQLSLSHSLSRSHDLPKSYSSFRRKTTYILEEEGFPENRHLGAAATPLWTRPSLYKCLTESSVGYHRYASVFAPPSYNIVFCLVEPVKEECDDDGKVWAHAKLYTIKIGPGKVQPYPLVPFWSGKIPAAAGLVALGSYLYSFGGKRNDKERWAGSSDVYKLPINPVAKEWVRVNPMICRRYCPEPWLLGGKLYVSNSIHLQLSSHWGEVFDPANGKWELVPDPPNYPPRSYLDHINISAALQNPDRLILARRIRDDDSSAVFYAYGVHSRCWRMLAPGRRNLHRLCLYDGGGDLWLEGAVGVNNTLYWVIRPYNYRLKNDHLLFLAYDLNLDMWLEGHLKGSANFFFLNNKSISGGRPDTRPAFFHLEKQRFCVFQCANHDVRGLIVEISHMPEEKNLSISLVWDQQYTLEPTILCEEFKYIAGLGSTIYPGTNNYAMKYHLN